MSFRSATFLPPGTHDKEQPGSEGTFPAFEGGQAHPEGMSPAI